MNALPPSLPFQLSSIPKPGDAAALRPAPCGSDSSGQVVGAQAGKQVVHGGVADEEGGAQSSGRSEETSRRDGSAGKFRVPGSGADMEELRRAPVQGRG